VSHVQVSLDEPALTATIGARRAKLNRREFAVLTALCQARGDTLTHDTLLSSIWGPHAAMPNLRMAISGLRKKLEADAELPTLIVTEVGKGYRLGRP
jgi:two-component system KDP operon response regulator KdpE